MVSLEAVGIMGLVARMVAISYPFLIGFPT